MAAANVLVDVFGRIHDIVHAAVEGLTPEQLAFRLGGGANSIAWLVWHLTRIQDDHVADAADMPQVWTSEGWAERFGLPFNKSSTGFGHSSEEVDAVCVQSADLLTGYHDAVHAKTADFVERLTEPELDRIVDESWDPPVSLAVRLVSVISDNLQHAGQAAFVRGIIEP